MRLVCQHPSISGGVEGVWRCRTRAATAALHSAGKCRRIYTRAHFWITIRACHGPNRDAQKGRTKLRSSPVSSRSCRSRRPCCRREWGCWVRSGVRCSNSGEASCAVLVTACRDVLRQLVTWGVLVASVVAVFLLRRFGSCFVRCN